VSGELTAAEHLAAARARLADVYRGKPVITAILTAFCRQFAEAEAALLQLDSDSLDTAAGAQLDGWGRILAESRGALDDDDYRGRLQLKLIRLHSEGTAANLVQIFQLLAGTPSVDLAEHFPAAVELVAVEPDSIYSDAFIAEAMASARAGGVSLEAGHTNGLPAFATLEYAGPHAVAGVVTDAEPTGGGTLVTSY
jgi:hypothetical protein